MTNAEHTAARALHERLDDQYEASLAIWNTGRDARRLIVNVRQFGQWVARDFLYYLDEETYDQALDRVRSELGAANVEEIPGVRGLGGGE